ncbi:MAG: pyridoxal-dependent decarboxylase [Candidatus Sedimenticola sp. 20ELBAFRAG]
MNLFEKDLASLNQLAKSAADWCCDFQRDVGGRPVAQLDSPHPPAANLPNLGVGSAAAMERFKQDIAPGLSGSVGPRYLGFVVGGTTPAAMLADWMVSACDQNTALPGDSISCAAELQALDWLRQLFHLPDLFDGVLTTGGTASNILGVLCGRQHAGLQQGIDIARDGLTCADIKFFSATPHASTLKALAIAGLGRNNLTSVACMQDSEAMDTLDLELKLKATKAKGKVVVASAGTVTGTAFDDLRTVAELCRRYDAWLHVDGAFGLFGRLSEDRRPWTDGIELADSIASDAHKWLNVPYDCGIFFTRHPTLLHQVCSVAAPYLDVNSATTSLMDRGIENSRRFRALPVWMSLMAYGREGFKELVEQNCRQAERLALWLEQAAGYKLMTPCNLNVVVFRPRIDDEEIGKWLQALNSTGQVFMTPGIWQGRPAIRAAFSNWRTTDEDVVLICQILDTLTPEQ